MIIRAFPVFSPRPWGDFHLNELFEVEAEEPIGEVWLLSDVSHLRSSFKSLDGEEISSEELVKATGLKLPRFPLLIKLISTTDWLSVQVHPDDDVARSLEGEPWGKNEGWLFLSDGEVSLGTVESEELEKSIQENRLESILKTVHVHKHDFLYLPAGILHALGPNTRLIEIQQTSDLTYRIYDWGRGRELHIDKALKAVKKVETHPVPFNGHVETPYFTVKELQYGEVKGFAVLIMEDFSTYIVPADESFQVKEKCLVVRLGKWWYNNFEAVEEAEKGGEN